MDTSLIIIAHSGLDRKIKEAECRRQVESYSFENIIFISFDIASAKLSELYDLPFEQLALEQQRKFKTEIEPHLKNDPNIIIAYFGLAPIPLAFQLGVLFNNFSQLWVYQFHHEKKVWYQETEPINGYQFEILQLELPIRVEKGKGDVFIRVGTSYRIEPQHTLEVLANPTNEFDITLRSPHLDGISNKSQLFDVVNKFQEVLFSFANYLPDRDKIHLFIASTTGLAFALGTKINPNVYPLIQTYQYSKDETPKYREAILITKKMDVVKALTEEEATIANNVREQWSNELINKIIPFIVNNQNVFDNWYSHIIQNNKALMNFIKGAWESLPDLSRTSLITDAIDLSTHTVGNGFKYVSAESKWQIDDVMLFSLSNRLSKRPGTDILRAGRLFLFHEALHYSQDGHCLTEEIATGIGRFPKVIEEADYQADVWGLLYEYRLSYQNDYQQVSEHIKKFFLDAIDTAVETMWSFVDNGTPLTEIQIRSMNRFLNWYWQWVRIERLSGHGDLSDVIQILFDKPTIEFAGAEVVTIDRQRTCFKLNDKPYTSYELAIFYKNKVNRFAPTGILKIEEGFRELNGDKIKEGLRSFLVTLA